MSKAIRLRDVGKNRNKSWHHEDHHPSTLQPQTHRQTTSIFKFTTERCLALTIVITFLCTTLYFGRIAGIFSTEREIGFPSTLHAITSNNPRIRRNENSASSKQVPNNTSSIITSPPDDSEIQGAVAAVVAEKNLPYVPTDALDCSNPFIFAGPSAILGKPESKGQESWTREAPVVYYWHKASKVDKVNDGDKTITLTTHFTLNRISRFLQLASRWNGPISASFLYCNSTELEVLTNSLHDNPHVANLVDIHVVSRTIGDHGAYPANLMRNVALEGMRALHNEVEKGWYMVLDVDAMTSGPMSDFIQQVQNTCTQLVSTPSREQLPSSRNYCDANIGGGSELVDGPPVVFVLAAFESREGMNWSFAIGSDENVSDQVKFPRTHQDVKQLYQDGVITAMHPGRPSYTGPFDHSKWLRYDTPTRLDYQPMFEPYYIARIPPRNIRIWFDERFVGRGFNKQSHHFQLWATEHEYFVVPQVFVVDLPHLDSAWNQAESGINKNKRNWQQFRDEVAQASGLECRAMYWRQCDRGKNCDKVCQHRNTYRRIWYLSRHRPRRSTKQDAPADIEEKVAITGKEKYELKGIDNNKESGTQNTVRSKQHGNGHDHELERNNPNHNRNINEKSNPNHNRNSNEKSNPNHNRSINEKSNPNHNRNSKEKSRGKQNLSGNHHSYDRDVEHWNKFVSRLEQRAKRKVDANGNALKESIPRCTSIDVVYTWVNGTDPKHLSSQQTNIPKIAYEERIELGEGSSMPAGDLSYRFRDWKSASTLRYSIRSLFTYAPWVDHIWIATAGQVPSWLKKSDQVNKKLTVIDHSQFFRNKNCLPTFNSCAIESQIHRIPGLSECYIYLNDDFLLTAPLDPQDLWDNAEPLPFVMFESQRAPRIGRDTWQKKVANIARLVQRRLDVRWDDLFMVGHHGHFMIKSIVEEMESKFQQEIDRTECEVWRTSNSFWVPFVYNNYLSSRYAVLPKQSKSKYVRLTDSSSPGFIRETFHELMPKKNLGEWQWLCLNDLMVNFPIAIETEIHKGLEGLYPVPSPVEY